MDTRQYIENNLSYNNWSKTIADWNNNINLLIHNNNIYIQNIFM